MPPLVPVTDSRAAAPRVELTGADLLRFLAVITVLYSHISFYVIDDLGTGWWGIDLVHEVFVVHGGLNQHLSFLGVAVFMMLTGALITRSAVRQTPGKFLYHRLARILPAFWVAVLAAVLLVKFGINGMFSGHETISNGEAALSMFFGGFFLKPQVVVLGVTWTLVVQIAFYLLCVASRPILRTAPVAMPIAGAALCSLILFYNLYISQPYSVPMLSRVAATLPVVFLGQIIYLGFAGLAERRWLVVAGLAQVGVIVLATDYRVYWAGESYLWTIAVVAAAVVLIGRYQGPASRWALVRWTSQRSFAIYLIHTLVLYRVYENTVGFVGPTGAVVAFLLVTAVVADVMYRWVEVPATRWLSARGPGSRRRAAPPGTTVSESGTAVSEGGTAVSEGGTAAGARSIEA
ncbi:acyltransferase [Rhodococcus triatomae]|uniref:Peptidoglycan/LPS O-acetylase OafA/YrhL, contains acyltransferase and SGNH-hydrolase domains n=1 Tax=Rhodococcus triatomae TaxID=300028 RepID=A0A1G8HUB1_9NOCA|nr:acyltransferase [Rhodococcus triatomae]QNG20877.1 acyltransferase [Rhodococcus triatomae]QNG23208.1 acyltransferase [Rhodococcus triatomae]SDI10091.1 Peptidoglycan/LPS O-acetylase OafA/YrhL, contains acyltransferase and SGNH-hydrolase domains [Rhodococcus triatomae]